MGGGGRVGWRVFCIIGGEEYSCSRNCRIYRTLEQRSLYNLWTNAVESQNNIDWTT